MTHEWDERFPQWDFIKSTRKLHWRMRYMEDGRKFLKTEQILESSPKSSSNLSKIRIKIGRIMVELNDWHTLINV